MDGAQTQNKSIGAQRTMKHKNPINIDQNVFVVQLMIILLHVKQINMLQKSEIYRRCSKHCRMGRLIVLLCATFFVRSIFASHEKRFFLEIYANSRIELDIRSKAMENKLFLNLLLIYYRTDRSQRGNPGKTLLATYAE